MVNALDTTNTWRRIKPRRFPSGPGFDVFIGDLRIGSFGKHTHETAWWWQLDSKLDTKRFRLKAGRRAGRMVGTTAGMKSTKVVALAALMAAWKSLHNPKSPGAVYQARRPHVRTSARPSTRPRESAPHEAHEGHPAGRGHELPALLQLHLLPALAHRRVALEPGMDRAGAGAEGERRRTPGSGASSQADRPSGALMAPMRVLPLSDLHFEFHADGGKEFVESLDPRGVDLLVLAGDIGRMDVGIDKMLALFRQRFGCPIIFVHGDHEFYFSSRPAVLRATQNAVSKLRGVHWLDNDIVEIGGRRILGTTLWYGRAPAPKNPLLVSTDDDWARGLVRKVTEKGVVDWTYPDFEIAGFLDWVYEEHERSLRFLHDNLRPGDIVVSHFLPMQESVPLRFVGSPTGWPVRDGRRSAHRRAAACALDPRPHTRVGRLPLRSDARRLQPARLRHSRPAR